MRNVGAPPVSSLRNPLRASVAMLPPFLPALPPGSVPGSFRRDEFAGLETDDKWFFVLSGRAVAAAGRIIGDVTRATDVT